VFRRSIAFPILAVPVLAVVAAANLAVLEGGTEWFVRLPSQGTALRNVVLTALLLAGGWALLPREGRRAPLETLLLVSALLFGLGSAFQFRLGHDVPPTVPPAEAARLADSVARALPRAEPAQQRREALLAIVRRNVLLRRDFEASRVDIRLARSLERAYGPDTLTRAVLDRRAPAPVDSVFYRALPVLVFLVVLGLLARARLAPWLSAHWRLVGVGGSLLVALGMFLYLKTAGGIRGAGMAPQEVLKLALPIAWAGLLIRYHDALMPETREKFTDAPLRIWLALLAMLSAPLVAFVLVRDFGQFLVIGVAQTLLLAWYTRSTLYVILFTAAFIASGTVLAGGDLPAGVTAGTVLGVVALGVVGVGAVESFRRRDSLWIGAALVMVVVVGAAAVLGQMEWVADSLRTPRARFALWLDLLDRHGDAGWWDRARQVVESLYAFDAGRGLGTGLGQGTPFLIPNATSDFLFSAVGEELGAAGGVMVILLYATLVVVGLRIASDLGRSSFAGLVVAGFSLLLGVQALIHIGGTMNVLPMTGITLPLMSLGMSSTLVTVTMIGAILAFGARGGESARRLVIRNPEASPVKASTRN